MEAGRTKELKKQELPIMDEHVRDAILKRIAVEPFARKFGIEVISIESGYSRVTMKYTSDMDNMFGMAHGGAVFALIDVAFETASNSHGTMAVALNMSVSYLAAASPGDTLFAEAREISRTRKTACYDIRVSDTADQPIAACHAMVYRKGTPLPFLDRL